MDCSIAYDFSNDYLYENCNNNSNSNNHVNQSLNTISDDNNPLEEFHDHSNHHLPVDHQTSSPAFDSSVDTPSPSTITFSNHTPNNVLIVSSPNINLSIPTTPELDNNNNISNSTSIIDNQDYHYEVNLPDLEYNDNNDNNNDSMHYSTNSTENHQHSNTQSNNDLNNSIGSDDSNINNSNELHYSFDIDEVKLYAEYETKIVNMVKNLENNPYHIKFLNFLVYLSNINFFPPIEPNSKYADEPIDYDLHTFIVCQKMEKISSPQFSHTVSVLKSLYYREMETLAMEQSKKIDQLTNLLNLYLHLKPLLYNETHSKYRQVASLFQIVKSFQKTNTCDIILKIQKTYAKEHKHRRILSEAQEECMNQWFATHSKYPYPQDDEKVILGALNNMSKSQLDNWFGNKRMRNKLKRQKFENEKFLSGQSSVTQQQHYYQTQLFDGNDSVDSDYDDDYTEEDEYMEDTDLDEEIINAQNNYNQHHQDYTLNDDEEEYS